MGNKIISTLLLLILGPLYFLLILNFAFKATALNPKYLKTEFSKQSVYTKVIAGLDDVVRNAEPPTSEGLSSSEIAKAIMENINPADLQVMVEMALDGKRGTEIQKQAYTKLEASLRQKYNALPVCVGEAEAACRPEGISFEQMKDADFMGAPINLNQALSQTKTVTVAAEKKFNWQVYLPYFFAFILLVVLLLLSRLFAGSWVKVSFPIGLYLFIIGTMSFLTGFFVLKMFVPGFLKQLPVSKSAYFYHNIIVPVSADIIRDTAVLLNKTCLYLVIAGTVFIVVSIILHFIKKK